MALMKRESKDVQPTLARFDRLFDDWMQTFRLPVFDRAWMPDELIRVDEFRENGTLVVKAELAGIDPEKDVELTVSDGMLHIEAERREKEETEEKGYVRKELRYGSFARTLPLPEGVSEDDIQASYKDGILEIRVPAPEPRPAKKVAITKS